MDWCEMSRWQTITARLFFPFIWLTGFQRVYQTMALKSVKNNRKIIDWRMWNALGSLSSFAHCCSHNAEHASQGRQFQWFLFVSIFFKPIQVDFLLHQEKWDKRKKDGSKNRRRSQTQEWECEKSFKEFAGDKKKKKVISGLCCEMMSSTIEAWRKAHLFVEFGTGLRGVKSSLPWLCYGHAEQKKAVQQLVLPTNDQSSEGLTQSGWCEEADENKQACGPHGLLFWPPAARGPTSIQSLCSAGARISSRDSVGAGGKVRVLPGQKSSVGVEKQRTTNENTFLAEQLKPLFTRRRRKSDSLPLILKTQQMDARLSSPSVWRCEFQGVITWLSATCSVCSQFGLNASSEKPNAKMCIFRPFVSSSARHRGAHFLYASTKTQKNMSKSRKVT